MGDIEASVGLCSQGRGQQLRALGEVGEEMIGVVVLFNDHHCTLLSVRSDSMRCCRSFL